MKWTWPGPSLSHDFLRLSSSRCSRHPDPGAGPCHLIGRLSQQQFLGADLSARPPAFNVPPGGRVTVGRCQERHHYPVWVGGLPHRNLHRHRTNHRPERTKARGGVLVLHGAVMGRSDCWQVGTPSPFGNCLTFFSFSSSLILPLTDTVAVLDQCVAG